MRNEDQFIGGEFSWFTGVIEDINDPDNLNRVKVRCHGWHTSNTSLVSTENLPWATVLQHTCQSGNDGQGESSGQLQPGAIVMGFFMDGENAQMPIVIGVMRVKKSAESLLAASSKVVLVLVLASKNKFTIVLPLNSGTFFTGCPEAPANDSARSKISNINDFGRYSISKK